jgi:hypothetical protein
MYMREAYTPKQLLASGMVFAGAGVLSHFFCTTSGTLQVKNTGAGGTDILAAFAVTAGNTYNFGFALADGAYAALTGGAQGTFGVGQ